MPKPCKLCKRPIDDFEITYQWEGKPYCVECWNIGNPNYNMNFEPVETEEEKFNKPSHYHEHEIDTIEFLKRGFPPEVLTGFLIGNIVKYTQRFEYKNGEEDLLKVVDYSKRLLEWYKENHS